MCITEAQSTSSKLQEKREGKMKVKAEILVGDNRQALKELPDASVQTVVTSPPYWGLRDYGHDNQIGLEQSPEDFIEQLCIVFDEVWRVLKDDGTIWVNLGDSYAGSGAGGGGNRKGNEHGQHDAFVEIGRPATPNGLKAKDLVGIPWRFAFAMQARGWYLRSDIIWHKPNPMPESVTDRPTKSHEYIFLMTKSPRYYYDHEAIKEDAIWAEEKRAGKGRLHYDGKRQGEKGTGQENFVSIVDKKNKRSVWSVNVKGYKEAHFATYPTELIEPCILAGSKENDTVLDPFSGSGTTGEVALKHGRNYIGLELNADYAAISEKRITDAVGMFVDFDMRNPKNL
jgi:DNA modification methylase